MLHTENRKRSIAKAVSWRIVATILTLFVIWAVTRTFIISLESTLAAGTVSTIAYYFHERIWNQSSWGRNGLK